MLDSTISRPRFKPVGITKGPGENAHEYTFVSRDDEQVLKNGEYVYYELADPDEVEQTQGPSSPTRRVLGRIIKRVPLRLYPDTFLAEPEIAPAQVAAMVGYDARTNELFELHVAIMGYYDAPTNSFINPCIPPQSGQRIRPADAAPVVVSVKDVVSPHIAIIASTGAGKSYLASVLVEELMQAHNKACVLIIDPHGEYGTLDQIANFPRFAEQGNGRRGGYQAQGRGYKTEKVKRRISTLTIGDMRPLFPEMTEKQQYLLSRALRKVSELKRGTPWSVADLKLAIKNVAKQKGDEDSEGADDSSTVHALSWRIDQRFVDSFTFDDMEHLDLPEIFKPGQCTVLQLNEIDERDQQVVVATLLRRLNKARMETERGKAHSGEF